MRHKQDPGAEAPARAILCTHAGAGLSAEVRKLVFLLALLSLQRPDPAAEPLGALGADPVAVRERLPGPAEGKAR